MLNLVIASGLASLMLAPSIDHGPMPTLVIPPVEEASTPWVQPPAPVVADFSQPLGSDSLTPALGDDGGASRPSDVQPPCRPYADEPTSQPDTTFARCWNLKKAAWENNKPSATGPSLPNMNTPLGQNVPAGGKPRETPTP